MAAQPISQPRAAAIYTRVSTAGQEEDGTSLATQEQRCREYAAQHGYAVVGVYRDVHTGAELHERRQLTELRGLVRRREIQAVIAYDLDRLSREQAHVYILDDEATRHGAELRFVTEEFDKTPIGKLIRSARGFAAEVEREKFRERSLRGKRANAEMGRLHNAGIDSMAIVRTERPGRAASTRMRRPSSARCTAGSARKACRSARSSPD
jgi:site-specific DNA recombinase